MDEASNCMLSQSRQTPKATYCVIPESGGRLVAAKDWDQRETRGAATGSGLSWGGRETFLNLDSSNGYNTLRIF